MQHLFETHKVTSINASMSELKRTALHEACERGRYNACDYLIQQGADVFCQDCRLATPCHVAARRGFEKIVQVLVYKYPNVTLMQDINGKTPLHLAIEFQKNNGGSTNSSIALFLIESMSKVSIFLYIIVYESYIC